MATETTNYNLTMPEDDDLYDISDFNTNMEIIDTAMAQTSAEIDGVGDTLDQIAAYIGTPSEEGETLFTHSTSVNNDIFYQASENYKYIQSNGDSGQAFTTNANLLMQFTAKYNGTVYFLIDADGYDSYYIYLFDVTQTNYFNLPSLSVSSILSLTASENYMARQKASDARGDKGFVVPVIAGHKYIVASENSIVVYQTKIGYDLVHLDDIVETDMPAVVEEE